MEIVLAFGGALVGAVFAAWRLRGDGETLLRAVRRVMPQAGPRPVVPK